MGRIKSVSICKERKSMAVEVHSCKAEKKGLIGDVHYGIGNRQVSLLPYEIVKTYFDERKEKLRPGRFGENLLVEGLDWNDLRLGDRFITGEIILEIVRIGAASPASEAYKGEKVCVPMEPYFAFCKLISEGELTEEAEICKL